MYFSKLFEPGRIGKLQLKNRIVLAPMFTHLCAEDGTVTDRMIGYYAERARGGCGLVIVEASYPRPEGYPAHLSLYDERFIPALRKLTEAIHDGGAKAAIQINPHRGRADETDPASASEGIHPKTGAKARALSINDIRELEEEVGEGARRGKEAGFDCIMIHGGTGYLVSEFLSPRTNRRVDDYGGNVRGRARFALELVDVVKKKTGAGYPIIFRMTTDEKVEGGFGLEDATVVSRFLEDAGVDAIDVVAGVAETMAWAVPYMYMPRGCNAHLSQAIKEAVKIPVSTAGRINDPNVAEQILRERKADFVTLGRALIADPQFPNKAKEGRVGDICKCIACCRCVESLFGPAARPLVCAVNPAVGKEKEFELGLKPATKRKRILVLGGGPGGMEAAMVAAQRGHDVTLWESSNRLGGRLNIASVPPDKEEIRNYIDYLSHHLDKLKVTVKLGKKATAQMVSDFSPDAVILAVGAKPLIPKIKGAKRNKVVVFDDVLSRKVDVGKRVVVIGGGSVGCETADFLAEKGKKVTIVEILPELAAEVYYPYADLLVQTLKNKGVEAFTGVKEEEITGRGLEIISREGKRISLEADAIVIATGLVADEVVFESIKGKVAGVYEVGDCLEARRIQEATCEGAEVGLRV